MLQSGEYDFGWNMQVEDEILARLEKGGKGKVIVSPGGNIEHIQLNSPIRGPRSTASATSLKTKHPRSAIRRSARPFRCWSTRIRSRSTSTAAPVPPANFVNNPARFVSKTTKFEFSVDKANEVLEKAGWKKGPTASARRTARS